jgi:hypothetical protein
MGRFGRSWELFKTSLSVVKADKELLWMPVLSALASIVTVMAIAGVGFVAAGWPETTAADGSVNIPGLLVAFALYIALAFIGLFFNAAVVASATERLKGNDPTLGSALSAAWAKAGKIFLWSIVVATVNVILQALRERGGGLGRALSAVGGIAWNLATFFMVPILLFEDEGIPASVKRSASTFKKTWGETVIGQGGLGIVGFVVLLATVLVTSVLTFGLMAVLGTAGAVSGLVISVVAILGVLALFAVLNGVYKAALYRYATTGQVGAGFQAEQLGGAFAAK